MEIEIEVESSEPSAARHALPQVVERSAKVSSGALATSFERFLTEVGEMLDRAPESIGPFVIDELELSVSIAATGDFRIASSTAAGALKVTLRRPAPGSAQA